MIYIDLDNTIRKTYISPVSQELISLLNKQDITIVSDTWDDVEPILRSQGLYTFKLITPLSKNNISLTARERQDGYIVRDDCVYIFKFPVVSYELMQWIYKLKRVRVIETYLHEDSLLCFNLIPRIQIPYVGSFLQLLPDDIVIEQIGKSTYQLENIQDGIMIGDALADKQFAYNHGLTFYHVNSPDDTLRLLQELQVLSA